MKIAIIGYGKMGKSIEKIAIQRKHTIIIKTNSTPKTEDIIKADIAIEFTSPTSVKQNIMLCFKNKIPIVCGTTGWSNYDININKLCEKYNGSIITSPNFSVGVNILFKINKILSKIMNYHPEYDVIIKETHHTQKIDQPSGTAIHLAKEILRNNKNKKHWILDNTNYKKNEIPILSKRLNNITGQHSIIYKSNIDDIIIKHIAHNRNGFALGAVIASEWLLNKKGCFTMENVLNM
jgi:4-hydroxy-tetrahydrodipicolinate reductase